MMLCFAEGFAIDNLMMLQDVAKKNKKQKKHTRVVYVLACLPVFL
jgi:hypothetical protein